MAAIFPLSRLRVLLASSAVLSAATWLVGISHASLTDEQPVQVLKPSYLVLSKSAQPKKLTRRGHSVKSEVYSALSDSAVVGPAQEATGYDLLREGNSEENLLADHTPVERRDEVKILISMLRDTSKFVERRDYQTCKVRTAEAIHNARFEDCKKLLEEFSVLVESGSTQSFRAGEELKQTMQQLEESKRTPSSARLSAKRMYSQMGTLDAMSSKYQLLADLRADDLRAYFKEIYRDARDLRSLSESLDRDATEVSRAL